MATALAILAALTLACAPRVHIDPSLRHCSLMPKPAAADTVSQAPMIDGLPECEAR